MILVRTQYSLNKDHQHLKWQPQKSWTLHQGFQVVQDKQLMQYPLIRRSKWKMRQRSLKIPKSECPDIWIRLPKHKWPKSWSSTEDPVVPLERNLYGHPLAGLLWEGNARNFYSTRLGKSFKLGMFICQPSKRTILVCVCGRYETSRQDRKPRTDLEMSHERRWSGRTNIMSWPGTFGMHSKRVYNK